MIKAGLLGRSILASRSPWLHEQEAKAQGFGLSYDLFDFTYLGYDDAELGRLLHRLADMGYCGVNVTFPFKQSVIPLLDELSECAEAVGAVNSVAMRDGRLVGYNTDKTGFQDGLREGLPGATLAHVLQLGAGGAGAAVAAALLSLGVGMLEISDIDPLRAVNLVERLRENYPACNVEARDYRLIDTDDVDGIVNTTPMGMTKNPGSAISNELINARHWVADIVYFPLETELLRNARERGCRVLDGRRMAVGQAALAFEIFTGKKADHQRMRESFLYK